MNFDDKTDECSDHEVKRPPATGEMNLQPCGRSQKNKQEEQLEEHEEQNLSEVSDFKKWAIK